AEEEGSLKAILLADIRTVFDAHGTDRMTSKKLADELRNLEGHPWSEGGGQGLNENGLAKLLRDYKIKPRAIRVEGGKPLKGYLRSQFKDAFERYLAPEAPAPVPQNETSKQSFDFKVL